ncbi:hypothetical protein D030_3676A, partial [Vibrio parahaemolyticus AQ3810]
MTHFWIR